MMVPMKTPNGEKRVTAHQAVLLALIRNALGGSILSQRTFLELYDKAVTEHFDAHKEFEQLEMLEHAIVIKEPETKEVLRWADELRKATRRT